MGEFQVCLKATRESWYVIQLLVLWYHFKHYPVHTNDMTHPKRVLREILMRSDG